MSALDKQRIRQLARAGRKSIPAEERVGLSSAACARLLAVEEVASARTLLAYMPTAEELDCLEAVERFLALGITIALPRIGAPGELELHGWEPGAALEVGTHGVREPLPDAAIVRLDAVDAVIVPGVAFDHEGHRLGFGGGYYDRLLARMPHAFRAGIGYDGQLVAAIPAEPHDMMLDVVVTPSRTVRARGRRRV